MFLGEFTHNLDTKNRLTMPAKFREQLSTGLVVTRNPSDHCLLVFPLDVWDKLAARISDLPLTDRHSALLRRAFFSAAEDLKPDKQGRILLNERLRAYAQLDTDVLCAGMNTFIELWNPDVWQESVLAQIDAGDLDEDLFAALNV